MKKIISCLWLSALLLSVLILPAFALNNDRADFDAAADPNALRILITVPSDAQTLVPYAFVAIEKGSDLQKSFSAELLAHGQSQTISISIDKFYMNASEKIVLGNALGNDKNPVPIESGKTYTVYLLRFDRITEGQTPTLWEYGSKDITVTTAETFTTLPYSPAARDIKATYTPNPSGATYSVDIVWGSMDFQYKPDSHHWNTSKMIYEDSATGDFLPAAADENRIFIANRSDVAISAALSFTSDSAYSAVSGAFSDKAAGGSTVTELSVLTAASLAEAPTEPPFAAAWLNLSSSNFSGKGLNSTKIGQISIQITAQP